MTTAQVGGVVVQALVKTTGIARVGGVDEQVLIKSIGKVQVGGVLEQTLVKSVGKAQIGGIRLNVLTGVYKKPSFEGWGIPIMDPPALPAPSFVAIATGGSASSTTTVTAPLPTGGVIQPGDFLVFAAFRNQGGTMADPPGWTRVVNVAGALLRLLVWTKTATGSDIDPTTTATNGSQYASMCAVYRGWSSMDTPGAVSQEGGPNTLQAPTVITTGVTRLIHIVGDEADTTGPGAISLDAMITPRGSTFGVSTFYKMRVGDEADLTAGPTENRTVSASVNNRFGYAVIPLKA